MIPLHVATIEPKQYLFLFQTAENCFQWFLTDPNFQKKRPLTDGAPTLPLAIRQGFKRWEGDFFSLLRCGFRYTLPVRDEVGCNALFHQMAESYSSSNGRYLDAELGHHCYVDFASDEALALWRKIR